MLVFGCRVGCCVEIVSVFCVMVCYGNLCIVSLVFVCEIGVKVLDLACTACTFNIVTTEV